MCWHVIVLARPPTHTSIYLARCAIVAHSKLYMMKNLFYSSPSVLIINSLIMFFHKRSIRAILQQPLLVSVYCPLGNLTKINDLNIFVELKINRHTV